MSSMYADPKAWDLQTVSGMIEKFLNVTHAKSLPKLEEYRILPDKVKHCPHLSVMYSVLPDRLLGEYVFSWMIVYH